MSFSHQNETYHDKLSSTQINIPNSLGNILICHEWLPNFDKGGSDYRLFQLVCELIHIGWHVVYVARARLGSSALYESTLRQMGCTLFVDDVEELQLSGVDIEPEWTFRHVVTGRSFRYAVMFTWFWRDPNVAERYVGIVKETSPTTIIVTLTDDAHWSRLRFTETLAQESKSQCHMIERSSNGQDMKKGNDASVFAKSESLRTRELLCYSNSDMILCISEEDRQEIRKISTQLSPIVLPFTVDASELHSADDVPFENRDGIVFIGSFENDATVRSVEWFLNYVWSEIHTQRPQLKLYIGGYESKRFENLRNKTSPSSSFCISSFADHNVHCIGHIPKLSSFFRNCRVFVAPQVIPVGICTKVLVAIANGLPVVTSEIGMRGLSHLQEIELISQTSPQAFATAVIRLHEDPLQWAKCIQQSRDVVLKFYSNLSLRAAIKTIFFPTNNVTPNI